jgi:hypothetical protein
MTIYLMFLSSYGEKGSAIIQSTLLRMYDPVYTPTDAFTPFTLTQFTEWFLVPHIATCLIAQDLDCSPETAWEEMVASSDMGYQAQRVEDDDEELDKILKENLREVQRMRRHLEEQVRRSTTLILRSFTCCLANHWPWPSGWVIEVSRCIRGTVHSIWPILTFAMMHVFQPIASASVQGRNMPAKSTRKSARLK